MTQLFEEAYECAVTGQLYLVDVRTGEFTGFPSAAYEVIDTLIDSGLFQPTLSLKSALAASARIKARLARRG